MSDKLFSIEAGTGRFSDEDEVSKAREVYQWYHDYLPPIPTLLNKKLGDGEAKEAAHEHPELARILLSDNQHAALSRLAEKHSDHPPHVLKDAIDKHPLFSGIERETESVGGRIGGAIQKVADGVKGLFSPYNDQTGVPKQEAPGAEYLAERGAFGFFNGKVTAALQEENPELTTPADYHQIYQAYLSDSEKDARFGEKVIGFDQLSDVCSEDMIFGWLRLGGTNPRPLTKLTAARKAQLAAKMELGDIRLADVAGPAATLDAEIAAGRLYYCDYWLLDGLPTQEGRHMFPAIGIFWSNVAEATTRVGRQLLPVAIQLGQEKGTPLLTPADPGWETAKIHFSVADFNYHEMGSHLSAAHFAQEAFVIAARRNLRSQHPVGALLYQIYYALLFNNALGRMQLVNPGGYTDRMMAGDLEKGSLEIVKSFYDKVWHFDHWNFRTFLEEKGTTDTEGLPVYPYRDDGLPLFDAVQTFAAAYVDAWYPDADDVVADKELQAWVEELVDPTKGNLATKGFPTEVHTKAVLSEVLSRLIWQAGPGHGGINYSQFQYFAVVPSAPGAAYAVEGNIMDVLPPLEKAIDQTDILNVLTQKLFDSPMGTFNKDFLKGLNPEAENAVKDYQRDLARCAEQVAGRNAMISRAFMRYLFLSPDHLPNSTNI